MKSESDLRGTFQSQKEEGPPKINVGVLGWLHKNLFSTWYNSLLTCLSLWVIYYTIVFLFKWGIWDAAFGTTPDTCQDATGACWSIIGDTWRLFLVGRYPFDEQWRILAAIIIIALIVILSFIRKTRGSRGIYLLYALSPVFIYILLRGNTILGLQIVDTSLWGGLLLTMLLAVVGIVFAFPLGILLALGRRSKKLPFIRILCVAYIELLRAVPIVTVLIMSSIMLPLFLPSGAGLDLVFRAQVGIIMFFAAYLAEEIRGGLQGIPIGQEEAAASLGLHYWQATILIILPQALRISIPPLVNRFIGIVKASTLVIVIGLFDLLGIAGLATANPKWLGKNMEAYVFVAVIYWIICFSISRYSRYLETKYKVR